MSKSLCNPVEEKRSYPTSGTACATRRRFLGALAAGAAGAPIAATQAANSADPVVLLGEEFDRLDAMLPNDDDTTVMGRLIAIEERMAATVATSTEGVRRQVALLQDWGAYQWDALHDTLIDSILAGLEAIKGRAGA